MKEIFIRLAGIIFFFPLITVNAQTIVPNGGMEDWINYGTYENPQYWDTPNQEISGIPFFGTTVVSKSTDHEEGSYSAKLETKKHFNPSDEHPGSYYFREFNH